MSKNYTSKDIKTLDGIEAIRTRPGMYIGTIDQDGIHHLILEVISNSIDEYLNQYGTKVVIETNGDLITVQDDGRGIPLGKTDKNTKTLKDIVTSLHSGGKFGQGGYSVSGGLHGIGLTAVNALSKDFIIISSRENKIATLRARKGNIIEYKVEDDKNQKETGTVIMFKPDPEIFGKTDINQNKIKNMVKELSYLTSGLEFQLNSEKFLSVDGLKDMIKERVSNPITDVVYASEEKEGFKVEVAFQYVDGGSERIYAFTNNIPNPGGGTHVTGFKTAFTNSLNKLAKEYGLLEKTDSNLSGDLLRRGMVAAVSVKMAEAPVFKSQTKEKLMTPGARAVVSQLVGEAFDKKITKRDIKVIVERAIAEQKALDAAKRAREAANKVSSGGKNMNSIKDLPSKLVDCKDRNGELWIVEGK